ncbi:MAG TPA: hypothetical protein DEB70_01480 [Planctomycetaceae bacterium]|nr:hypothetical protein [Planctomycetaceae bacterium]
MFRGLCECDNTPSIRISLDSVIKIASADQLVEMGDLGKLFAFVELGLNAAKLSNISRFSLFNQTKIRLRLTK